VETLIRLGAKLEAADDGGMTAYDHAISAKAEHVSKVMRRLLKSGAAPAPRSNKESRPSPDERFSKLNPYTLEVRESPDLGATFNFWTQQVIWRDTRSAAIAVQNFADIQRQAAIAEAYEKLIKLGGNPPPLALGLDKASRPRADVIPGPGK
jgi:hypothetical protein